MKVTELMGQAIDAGASDLHLNPGRPPVARVDGRLVSLGTDEVTDEKAQAWCRDLCDEVHWEELERMGTTDIGLAHETGNRFRVSCMKQRGRYTAILRLIPVSYTHLTLPTILLV